MRELLAEQSSMGILRFAWPRPTDYTMHRTTKKMAVTLPCTMIHLAHRSFLAINSKRCITSEVRNLVSSRFETDRRKPSEVLPQHRRRAVTVWSLLVVSIIACERAHTFRMHQLNAKRVESARSPKGSWW